MIPANAITAWGVDRMWPTREQVEQDLLLSRAISQEPRGRARTPSRKSRSSRARHAAMSETRVKLSPAGR